MAELVPTYAVENKESDPSDGQQSDADKKIGTIVHELLGRSKIASQQSRKSIPDNFDFFLRGKQWNIDRPAWRFKEVLPISLGTMLQEVGIQTDGRPKTDFVPQEPTDTAFIDVLQELNNRNWAKSSVEGFGWPNKLEEHIFEVKYSDWSWAEICWDPTLEPPLGDIGWRKLDPTQCYWDPIATELKKLRWFIYMEPVPTQLLKAQYPDKAQDIKPDFSPLIGDDSINKDYNIDREYLASMLETGTYQKAMEDENKFGGEAITMKIRCWLRDTAVEEVAMSKKDEAGMEEMITETRLKYPKGRYVEMAGKTVLCDHENGVKINGEVHPYEDSLFPVAMLRNYSVPGKLVGLSEAPFMRGTQKIINYTWSFALDSMKMSMNPKVTLTPDAGELADEITNEPGAVFEVPRQESIKFHPGDGIAPGLINLVEMSMGMMDKTQGVQEVSRGASQPGITSGLMMEGFVEASQTRPRLKNRNVDCFLQQVGYLCLSRMLQFYTALRITRVVSPKEGWPKYIEFQIGQSESGEKMASVTPLDNQDGRDVRGNTKQFLVKGMPDVIVQSGSALPYARAQKHATALELFRANAIDIETLLDDIGRTDTKQILDRLEQQAQKQAQMMPPGGGA